MTKATPICLAMRSTRAPGAVAIFATLALAMPMLAQAQDAETTPSANPLAGPTVSASAQPTLVSYDFDGRLKALDDDPAALALVQLDITDDQRDACIRIMAEHHAAIDRVFNENIELILRLASAAGSSDERETRKLGSELYLLFKPVRDRGTLASQLAPALDDDTAEQLQTMVKLYRAAQIEQIKADVLLAEGESITTIGASIRRRYIDMQLELELAFARSMDSGVAELEEMLDAIGVEGDIRGKVRQHFISFGQRTLGEPTDAQGLALVMEVMNMLETPAQRGTFLRYIIEEERAKKAAGQSMDSL